MMTQVQHDWLITEGYKRTFKTFADWWAWVSSEHDRGSAQYTGIFVPMDNDGRQVGAPRLVTRRMGEPLQTDEYAGERAK